jgi:hypothetical protein
MRKTATRIESEGTRVFIDTPQGANAMVIVEAGRPRLALIDIPAADCATFFGHDGVRLSTSEQGPDETNPTCMATISAYRGTMNGILHLTPADLHTLAVGLAKIDKAIAKVA